MDLATYFERLPRGGKKLFAIKLGVSASYLSRLVSGDRSITAERAIQIEDATGGVVSRLELRPDIPWGQCRPPKKATAKLASTMSQKIRPISSPSQSTEDADDPSSKKATKTDTKQ